MFLVGSLETTVANLGGSINEFNIDSFSLPGLGGWEDRLSESDRSLSGTHDTALDQDEVLVDLTVVWETTHRSDVLGDSVGLCGGVVVNTGHSTSSNSVDLVVDVSSGVVTELTAAGDRPLDGGRMPGTDTGDLAETSMCLTVQTGHAESLDHTACSLTTGNTDSINALGHLEDLTDADLLLEFALGPFDLISDGSTVDLDLHDVGLVLAEAELADLSSSDDTDNSSVLLDALEVTSVVILGGLVLVFAVNILAESLLLGSHPVLVETALDIVVEVLGEDGAESTEATGSLDISDESNNLHWWALNDGDRVDDILLDGLLTLTALLILDDVGHASLVAHEGSKVDGLALVVTGE